MKTRSSNKTINRTAVFFIFLFVILLGKSFSQTTEWISLGPEGGKITSFAIDPRNSSIVYAGTWAGGVYKSIDGGESWFIINHELNGLMISSLAIDPQLPDIIYASGRFSGGVFQSKNGGANWSDTKTPTTDIQFVRVDPNNPFIVYAGNSQGQVYKSINRCATWEIKSNGIPLNNLSSMAIDPEDTATLYVTGQFAVYKSTDGAETWSTMNSGLPTFHEMKSIVIDPNDSSTIFIGGEKGIFKSIDKCETWSAVNKPLNVSVSVLYFNQDTPSMLYAGTTNGIFKSPDGGDSWLTVFSNMTDPYILSLIIDPNNSSNMFAGTEIGGIFKSINGGAYWADKNKGLRTGNSYAMAVDPMDPKTVYASISGGASSAGGLIKTINGGMSWELLNKTKGIWSVFAIAIDPKNPKTVYTGNGGLYKSTDGGESWQEVNTGIQIGWVNDIEIYPQNPSIIYVGGLSALIKTTDGGATWTLCNDIGAINININPQDPDTIYVYANQFDGTYKSTNGGESWEWILGSGLYGVYMDPQNPSIFYSFRWVPFEGKKKLFKSLDGCKSWVDIEAKGISFDPEILGYTSRLTIDPKNPKLLYLTHDGHNGVYYYPALYVSSDSGENWTPINNGLPETGYISEFKIAPSNPSVIYLGVSNRGIYSNTKPDETSDPSLSIVLSNAAAVFIDRNNKLRKIDLSGNVENVLSPNVNVAQFQFDYQGNLIIAFHTPQKLNDGNKYILVKTNPQTNEISGIDKSLASLNWNLSSVSQNVQVDYSGNIYYLAWTDKGNLSLRKYVNESKIIDYIDNDDFVFHWQARWDGTMVIGGETAGTAQKWLRKIDLQGNTSDITSSRTATWILQFPDNRIYAGFPEVDGSDLYGVYRLTQNLSAIDNAAAIVPYIGDSNAGYNPDYDAIQMASGHTEAYCKGLTAWAGGRIISYEIDDNQNVYGLMGYGSSRTIVKLYPVPEIIEPVKVDQVLQMKESHNKLVILGTKNGGQKLISLDLSTKEETDLTPTNIEINHFDVSPNGNIIFEVYLLALTRLLLG